MSNYGTEAGADAYHAERGNTVWTSYGSAAKIIALTRATDYIDQMFRTKLTSGRFVSQFVGEKAVPLQFREWPREDVVDYEGNPVSGPITPEEIEYATYEAALREAESPGYLFPDYIPSEGQGPVIQETVGPITVKYSDLTQNVKGFENRPPNMPIIPSIERLVAPYIKGTADTYGVGIMTV